MRPIRKTFNRSSGGLGAAVAALLLGLLIAAPSANAIPFSTSELTGDKFSQGNLVHELNTSDVGRSIDADGDRVAVAGRSPNVHILERQAAGWTETATFAVSNSPYNLSAFSLDGNRLLANNEVYVESSPGNWQLEDTLMPAVVDTANGFPNAGAIEGDTVVIGHRNETLADGDHGHNFPGAAWVFKRDGGSWVEQQRLTSTDTSHRGFGDDVDIDDGRIVVGQAHGLSPRNELFRELGIRQDLVDAVRQLAEDCTEGEAADSVPCDAIGTLGVLLIDGLITRPDGAVYVFTEHGAGNDAEWLQQARLNAPQRLSLNANTWGTAVSIDGDTIAVGDTEDIGQPTKDLDVVATLVGTNLAGVAEDLLEDPEGTVAKYEGDPEQLIIDLYSGPATEDLFGEMQRTEEDIETIVANATRSGSVTVFRSLLNDPSTWLPEAKLTSLLTKKQSGFFGEEVVVDGNRIVVGASSTQGTREVNPFPLIGGVGATYVFERSAPLLWLPKQVLEAKPAEEVCFGPTCFTDYSGGRGKAVAAANNAVFEGAGSGFITPISGAHVWEGASPAGLLPLPEEVNELLDSPGGALQLLP